MEWWETGALREWRIAKGDPLVLSNWKHPSRHSRPLYFAFLPAVAASAVSIRGRALCRVAIELGGVRERWTRKALFFVSGQRKVLVAL